MGAVYSQTKRVTDEMFLGAAKVLAEQVGEEDLALGRIFPSLTKIREVSLLVACEVARIAYEEGLTDREAPNDLLQDIRDNLFQPIYQQYA